MGPPIMFLCVLSDIYVSNKMISPLLLHKKDDPDEFWAQTVSMMYAHAR